MHAITTASGCELNKPMPKHRLRLHKPHAVTVLLELRQRPRLHHGGVGRGDDIEAMIPKRFDTPHNACFLLSLLLFQQLLLWMLSRTSLSQLYELLLEASVPAATTIEAVKYAVASSRQSAQGGLTRLITRAAC